MIIFDYFFYTVYLFLNKKLKRGKEDAKFSALSILAVYMPLTVDIIAYIIGLLHDNQISKLFLNMTFIAYIIIGAIIYLCFGIRYYKLHNVEDIGHTLSNLSANKRNFYKWIVYLILISVPILSFITYRLYKFGYV